MEWTTVCVHLTFRHQLIEQWRRRSKFGRRVFSVAGPMASNSLMEPLQDPALDRRWKLAFLWCSVILLLFTFYISFNTIHITLNEEWHSPWMRIWSAAGARLAWRWAAWWWPLMRCQPLNLPRSTTDRTSRHAGLQPRPMPGWWTARRYLRTANFSPLAALSTTIRLDWVVFYVTANTVQVIWETVFTGQKTQPTVSKYWRRCYKGKKQKTQTTKYTNTYTIIDNKRIQI